MVKVKMQNDFDCGPVQSFNAIEEYLGPDKMMPYDEYLRKWRWPGTGEWRDNLRDQPGDHIAQLRLLGVPYRRVSAEDIIANKCPFGRTVILLHDPEDPIFNQHWCRYVSRLDHEQKIFVDWGNGKNKAYSFEEFRTRYRAGRPDFAYVVGENESSQNRKAENWFWLRLQGIVKRISSWF